MARVDLVDNVFSWIQNLWTKINIESWFHKIGINSPEAIRISTFLIVAFVIGFLFKKYFKFALGCFIVITILFFVLESRNILTVDWVAFKEFLGIDPTQAEVSNIFASMFAWIKDNLLAFSSAAVGFLFGYKLG